MRAVARIANIHLDTVFRLVRLVGDRCAEFLAATVQGVEVADVHLDDIWSFVGAKQATLDRRGTDDPTRGDAWSYLAVERNSKMILTHLTASSRDIVPMPRSGYAISLRTTRKWDQLLALAEADDRSVELLDLVRHFIESPLDFVKPLLLTRRSSDRCHVSTPRASDLAAVDQPAGRMT